MKNLTTLELKVVEVLKKIRLVRRYANWKH